VPLKFCEFQFQKLWKKDGLVFEDSQIEADCTGDTTLLATPHPAFDAGRPCRTSQRNRHKQACGGIVAPQSPPCHPAEPWSVCGRKSRGIARIGIGSHPGEAYAPFRSTAYRDFAWMSPIPFRCASASALRRRVAKAVSHLLLRRLCLVLLPLPPQLSTAGYRDPGQLQGASSLHTPVVAVCFLPPCLPLRLRKRKPWQLNASVFAKPSGSAVSRKLYACRAKTESASLPAPLCYPCPPTALLREGQRTLTCAHTHTCVCVRLSYYVDTLTLL
jgi:hypothetical protein